MVILKKLEMRMPWSFKTKLSFNNIAEKKTFLLILTSNTTQVVARTNFSKLEKKKLGF